MKLTVQQVNDEVQKQLPTITHVMEEMGKVMVGKRNMLEKLLIGLFADGHVLVEGVPGLAKTTAVKTLSDAIQAKFRRIQFTPDLLPADLIGTQIYSPKTGDFTVKQGRLHEYPDGAVAIFKGPHRLATFPAPAEPAAQGLAA